MDILSLVFYAIVCGLLSVFAPNFGSTATRMGIGAVVGIAAAALLPMIRGVFGGY
ncbi:hypothetical protein C8N43_2308 [Litoreibacter ponti]|uniref:Uncharacterized protein n=1 Tax=Litoreibacter ponti TaxID=1510457 RepID=A0A2T6BNS1_9RHOB|nr:hypothetical protein [Litoreibacter ponti]PTX57637.1 hypothetical protein C8N43_2308 [Litoreibacter ponti]